MDLSHFLPFILRVICYVLINNYIELLVYRNVGESNCSVSKCRVSNCRVSKCRYSHL